MAYNTAPVFVNRITPGADEPVDRIYDIELLFRPGHVGTNEAGEYVKRVHLFRNSAVNIAAGLMYVADPAESGTTENPAPGTNLQYEIYSMQIYTVAAQAAVTVQGFDGDSTYTTRWARGMAAGQTAIVFPENCPLLIGENLQIAVTTSAVDNVRIKMFGAVRPVA